MKYVEERKRSEDLGQVKLISYKSYCIFNFSFFNIIFL